MSNQRKGLPDFMKSRHDNHLVEELASRSRTVIIRHIPVEKVVPNPLQPRKDFGDLSDLAESIKEKGIIEPIIVRPKDGKYEIVAGERRYRAAKNIGLKTVPCIEHDLPDNEVLEVALIENLQRKDLSIFESAYSLSSLAEIYGYTHQEIAQKIGKSRVTITELLRITDLPAEVAARCEQLGINSKTFLLELVKLGNREEMDSVLDAYEQEPFSRDDIKRFRQGREEEEKQVESQRPSAGPSGPPIPAIRKPIRFHFASEDKSFRLDFRFQAGEQISKERLITLMERMLDDLREGRIKNLPFKNIKDSEQ